MKIKIITKSPILSASGESTALIDSDVKYDKYGFPYIQAKTFKGLLRESATEVCEIIGNNYALIDELFGKKGDNHSGILEFNNIYIKGYNLFFPELKINPAILKKEFVKRYYTEFRQQTTIENGIAKDKSLRKYRLIKEGTEFETEIDKCPTETELFLKQALINLRYIGLRRNRGFGKIEIAPDDDNNSIKPKLESGPLSMVVGIDESLAKLSFELVTKDTLLIAKIFGEQNTVSTEHFIPAQNVRGLIASLLIKNKSLSLAHEDDDFKDIILKGKVKFNNVFIKDYKPIPIIYGYDKTKNDSKAEIIPGNNKPLKGLNGFGRFSDNSIEIKKIETSYSFHHSRMDNRLAGRSTENTGAIFYYEGIQPDQIFEANLFGPKNLLEIVKVLLNENKGIHRIGKSKSAQYSKIKICNLISSDVDLQKKTELKSPFLIVFQSPVITYNQFGIAIPSLDILNLELKSYFKDISKITIVSNSEMVENYMGIWKSKTPRELAFGIGTTIKIEGKIDDNKLNELILNGLGERKTEGYGRIEVYNLKGEYLRIDAENSDHKNNHEYKFKSEILKEIFKAQEAEKKETEIKIVALKKSKEYRGKLPNSLISRLFEVLSSKNDLDNWKKFIKEIEGKKAHKTLDEANLWDEIRILKTPKELDIIEGDFYCAKIYWLMKLKALRIKKIK